MRWSVEYKGRKYIVYGSDWDYCAVGLESWLRVDRANGDFAGLVQRVDRFKNIVQTEYIHLLEYAHMTRKDSNEP